MVPLASPPPASWPAARAAAVLHAAAAAPARAFPSSPALASHPRPRPMGSRAQRGAWTPARVAPPHPERAAPVLRRAPAPEDLPFLRRGHHGHRDRARPGSPRVPGHGGAAALACVLVLRRSGAAAVVGLGAAGAPDLAPALRADTGGAEDRGGRSGRTRAAARGRHGRDCHALDLG